MKKIIIMAFIEAVISGIFIYKAHISGWLTFLLIVFGLQLTLINMNEKMQKRLYDKTMNTIDGITKILGKITGIK